MYATSGLSAGGRAGPNDRLWRTGNTYGTIILPIGWHLDTETWRLSTWWIGRHMEEYCQDIVVSFSPLWFPVPTVSYPNPTYPVLSYFKLCYPILSHPFISYPVLCYAILTYSYLSCAIIFYHSLNSVQSCSILPRAKYCVLSYPLFSLSFPSCSFQSYLIPPYPLLCFLKLS